jgi:hypothetical protein
MRRPVYDRRFVDRLNQIDALNGAKRRPALKKNSNTKPRRKQTEIVKTPRGIQIVGVDVSDKISHYCVLAPDGQIAAEGTRVVNLFMRRVRNT